MRALLLAASLAAAAAGEACELPGGAAQRIESPRHLVLYRSQPAPLRIGEHFALEFVVCPAPESVRVDAWMPEHRHGMNYRPTITALGGGRYRAEGLMLHMAGRWELVFEVRADGSTERIAQSIQLQ